MIKRLALFAFIFGMGVAKAQNVKNVSAVEFKKLMTEQNTVVIDLRTNDEINSKGFIKNMQQIDYLAKDADSKIEKLDRSKSYLLYCAGGGRSADAAEQMIKLGFKNVINLEKGFDDWKKQGLEVEKKQ